MRFPESFKHPSSIRQVQNAFRNKGKDKSPSDKTEEFIEQNVSSSSPETLDAKYPTSDDFSFKALPIETHRSAKPLLALLKAYECKVYYEYEFNSISNIAWHISLKDRPGEEILVQRLVLIGASMILEGDDFGVLHVSLVDEMGNTDREGRIQDGLSFDGGQIILRCNDLATKDRLERLRLLSIFEYLSTFKALTGSIISTIGVRMPDMQLILSSAFNFKDWCEVYLEGQGWVKLWCYIKRVKKTSQGKVKSQNQIKFFKDDRCNNLVCFIPDAECVQDIFFYSQKDNKSPTYSESTTKTFLNSLTTIKVLGDVCFPSETRPRNLFKSPSSINFNLSKSNTRTSLASIISTNRKRSRTEPAYSTPSVESVYSERSSIKDPSKLTTHSGGLLIRPLVHEALGHLESMIRFIVPMMDCTQKYGRPGVFKKDKYDSSSLMFGLPRLPSVDYFGAEEMEQLLDTPLMDGSNSRETTVSAMRHFTAVLDNCIQKNPKRESKYHFQTLNSVLVSTNDEMGSQIPQKSSRGDPVFPSVSSNNVSLV